MSETARDRVPEICFGLYGVAVAISAVRPSSAAIWLAENSLAWVIVLAMLLTRKRQRFSNRTYVQGLLFLLLHTYGSHYMYSCTPLGDWAMRAFELTRNHYDRLVHAAFGLLLFVPLRELLFRHEHRRRLLTELALTLGAASLVGVGYELIEWASAVVVGGEAAADFLGAQGDIWDTHADLLCNLLGGVLAVGIELALAKRSRVPRGAGTHADAGGAPLAVRPAQRRSAGERSTQSSPTFT
jgi:putative membrane protein